MDDRLRQLQRQAKTSNDPETIWHYTHLLEKLVGDKDINIKLWMVQFTCWDRSDLSWSDGMYLTKALAAKSACATILEFSVSWVCCDESQALHDARQALYNEGAYEKLIDEFNIISDDEIKLVEMSEYDDT